jgi:hypothetical protein
MGLFPVSSRPMHVLDTELVNTDWPNVLWRNSPATPSCRPLRSLSRFPSHHSRFQLRAATRRFPGRALKSIQRTLLKDCRFPVASTSRRWMLPTVERGPPVHFSV